MNYDNFKKAEKILYEIRQLKALIGESINDRYGITNHITSAEEDDGIKTAVRNKIESLLKEFESL